MKKFLLLTIFIFFSLGLFISSLNSVVAQTGSQTKECESPTYIPKCTLVLDPNSGEMVPDYVPDLNCAARKIIDPKFQCCYNKCRNKSGESVADEYLEFVVFNTNFRINPENVPSLINLGFSTFLGIVSVYALFRGIYVAGVKRTEAITPDDIEKLNKELTSLVIGFVIAWAFILIIQIVANILGVGDLSRLDVSSESGGENNIVIRID